MLHTARPWEPRSALVAPLSPPRSPLPAPLPDFLTIGCQNDNTRWTKEATRFRADSRAENCLPIPLDKYTDVLYIHQCEVPMTEATSQIPKPQGCGVWPGAEAIGASHVKECRG